MKPKILITTNALLQSQDKLAKAYDSIFNFASQASLQTQLASAVSPDLLSWPSHFDDEWGNEFMRLAKKIANENLKEYENRSSEPPELILQTINSKKQSVRSLIDYAKNSGAGMISAIAHLSNHDNLFSFPGSFVETLVAESPLPVLVVNSQSDPMRTVRRILVPTDFSKACRFDFGRIVELSKSLRCQIVLMHVLTVPDGMGIVEGAGLSGGWPRIESFIESVVEEANNNAREMISFAKNEAIEIEFKLIRNRERLTQVILDQALSARADLIAMTNQTGPIASLILGSMTRQLMRSSQLPILVFPPHAHDILPG